MNMIKHTKLLSSLTLALAVVSCATARAEERESLRYSDAEAAVGSDTLLVTDLDNTVLMPPQQLGSDQWGGERQARLKAQGHDAKEAVDLGVSLFARVQFATRVIPVEREIPAILARLQRQGVKVLGLTARPLDIAHRTHEQLRSIHVRMSGPTDALPDGAFGSNGSLYKDGVLFVGPHNNKGKVLVEVLKTQKRLPARIIFIDDKAHHVRDVVKELREQLGIEALGLRYGAADERVKAFTRAVGDRQWEEFLRSGRILSDDEAAQPAGLR